MSNKNGKIPYSDENVGNIDDLDLDIGEVPELSDKQKEQFKNRYGKRSIWDRFKRTFRGKNDFGKYFGLGLDVGESFLPHWVSRIRDIFQRKTNTKRMNFSDKLKKVRNWISWHDKNGEFSFKELGLSLLKIAVPSAVVYVLSHYGIWDNVIQIINIFGN